MAATKAESITAPVSEAWVSRRCPSFKAPVISRAKPASSSSASAATDAVKLEKVLVTGCTNRAGYRVGDDTAYAHDVLSNIWRKCRAIGSCGDQSGRPISR